MVKEAQRKINEFDVTWSEQGWVEGVRSIGRGDNFDLLVRRETVKLIQQFQHSTLHFAVAALLTAVTLRADGIQLVDEDDRSFSSFLVDLLCAQGVTEMREAEGGVRDEENEPLARSKASRISLAPSPMYICTSWGPANFKKTASVFLAQARASKVFPVPGGP